MHHPGEVYIELQCADRYYPDFIAVDRQGINWLIEGKSDREAMSQDAVRKKLAAEEWATFACDDGRFGTWKYMFAPESMISRAKLSWSALVAQSKSG